jgi:hypothetical protein
MPPAAINNALKSNGTPRLNDSDCIATAANATPNA